METILFWLLALTTIVPAVLVCTTVNIVRAATWLLLSLTGAAGLFFLLGADFVGATQLLIYVGGTLVLVIFGVMLTATGPFVNLSARSGDWAVGILAASALFGLMAFSILRGDVSRRVNSEPAVSEATSHRVGMAFLGLNPPPKSTVVATKPTPPKSVQLNQDIVGRSLSYILPFEIVSVHLIVVLVGAAYLARAKRRKAEVA